MADDWEKIFRNCFLPRRTALLRAFTQDLHLLVEKCDPASEALCLDATFKGTWELKEPEEYLPCARPEHYVGLNQIMLGTSLKEWIFFAVKWSDSWLLRYAFFVGGALNTDERAELFQNINELNTLLVDVEKYYASKGIPEDVENMYNIRKTRASITNDNNPIEVGEETTNSRGMRQDVQSEEPAKTTNSAGMSRDVEREVPNENQIVEREVPNENQIAVEDNPLDDEEDETYCGKCNKLYRPGQFWIFCETCKKWFHARCVRVTKKQSEQIEKYKCPQCRVNERSRKRNLNEI